MLFDKKIDPRCAYCRHASPLDDDMVACLKRGVVSAGGHCRAFCYDPLKRVPPRPADAPVDKFKDEDFSL